MRFGRETWSLVVPDGWRAWHDDECATLVGPGEIGALQISAAFKRSGEVLDVELRGFARKRTEAGAVLQQIEAGDFAGVEVTFCENSRAWKQWFLRNGQQVLFVTYNCALEFEGAEVGPVRLALASLRAISAG